MAVGPQFSLLEGSCPTLRMPTYKAVFSPKQVPVGPVIPNTSNPIRVPQSCATTWGQMGLLSVGFLSFLWKEMSSVEVPNAPGG